MKSMFVVLVCVLVTSQAYSFELTQDHIRQAEMARDMGLKMGLNKATPEQMVEAAIDMAAGGETEVRALTRKEKKAMTCMMARVLDMQFESDIKEYARFMSDDTYRVEINSRWAKKCGVHSPAK